ncbi:MAG: universal stress protein [Haloarculaceae archaeon]
MEPAEAGEGPGEGEPAPAETEELPAERFRVLVPVARPSRVPHYVRLAAALSRDREDEPFVQVLNVTQIPDQTPHEMVTATAQGRADRIAEYLADEDLGVEYSVEGHTSRDVAFDILQTARNDEADLILMGYPEEHRELTEAVEYKAPCDVVFASGFADADRLPVEQVTVGAGGGPHHEGSLSIVRALGEQGASVTIVSVDPAGGGTAEDPEATIAALDDLPDVEGHETEAETVAAGLVEVAAAEGGVLLIGASRDRRLSQWVLGSTPDRVVDRAETLDVPVLIYATAGGVPGRIEDYLFPVYRYLRGLVGGGRTRTAEQD